MNLSCPNCDTYIPPQNRNISEGICQCPQCYSVYKLSQIIDQHPRIVKPEQTSIQAKATDELLAMHIPPKKRFSLLFFALIWNASAWGMTTFLIVQGELFPILFMSLFIIVGMGTLIMGLYEVKGTFSFALDASGFHAKRTLFRFEREKIIPLEKVVEVEEKVSYSKNNQPVYGINLVLTNGSYTFGSGLTKNEREWIINEINHTLDKLRS